MEALRTELERAQAERADETQAAMRDANDQVVQLQATVVALRTELEEQATKHTDVLADAHRAFRDEREQLTQMITALRTQLEFGKVEQPDGE